MERFLKRKAAEAVSDNSGSSSSGDESESDHGSRLCSEKN